MPKPKIDIVKLYQMLRSGKSVKQCAEYFGVTPPAISMAKKSLHVAVVKNVALESAHKVVDNSLDAVGQLKKINDRSNAIIDELSSSSERADKQLILKACAEIRGQLALELEILRSLHDMQAVAEFQREVLGAIGEVAPDVRNKIIQRLKERRAVRQSLSLT